MNLEKILRELVENNRARLFPQQSSVEIRALDLGPAMHHNENRFHRALTVGYSDNGVAGSMPIWLKFRPGLDRLFPVLDAYHRRLGEQLFPMPYFGWHSPDESVSLLASQRILGTSLRDKLLRSALIGQTRRLDPAFRAHGAKMRSFHDAFPATEWIYAQEVAATVAAAVRSTPYLSSAEKSTVLGHAKQASGRLSVLRLPAIRNHNDWILRNIVVTAAGADFLIDCDSMRYRANWRWYDLAFLLLNVESGQKWAPLLTLRMLSRLWRAFWQGYVGANGIPDGLSAEQLRAILYLVRLHWLFSGVVRQPNFAVLGGALNERFRRPLRDSVVEGRFSQLDFTCES